jgi:hypothetical protein
MILAKTSMNMISSIMIMIGGLIGILAVFTAWISMDLLIVKVSMTGWEITKEAFKDGSDYAQWMPLLVLIFSVIALLIGLSTFVKPHKAAGAGALASGILVLIFVILFWTYTEPGYHMSDWVSTGVYLAAAAGVLILIFGALRMTSKNK